MKTLFDYLPDQPVPAATPAPVTVQPANYILVTCPDPPITAARPLFLVQICPTVIDAVTLALQCRKTHPEEPIEIWPAKQENNPKRVVLREKVEVTN